MSKKRDGTSGVGGQLYESKLISLIHFRAKVDDDIEDYNLASNVAEIGTFDDICIRAKVKVKSGYIPVAVFIQAKHMEKINLNSKKDLAKWFSSYLNIRRLFEPSNKDVLFKGNFEETECIFIMYTNAKASLNTELYESDFADKLNSWIGTGNKGLKLKTDEDSAHLCEVNLKEELVALALQLAKFLSYNANDDGPIMQMCEDLVLRYHVILVQKVLNVSEIECKNKNEEHRVASFQTDFFSSDDDFLKLFKDTLLNEIMRLRKIEEPELNSLLSKLYIKKKLNITVLSRLIGNVVIFNDKKFKLQFVTSKSDDLRRQLEKVDVQQSQINDAIELALLAAKDKLKKRKFKVPAAFGNKDLTIKGKEDYVEPSMYIASAIDKLANKLVNLIMASPTEKIISIEENKKMPELHSGLAGAIGNILVSDDDNPKYAKFTTCDKLGSLAKKLYAQVLSQIPNLHNYKFHIKIKTFPKLTFVCDKENLDMLKNQVTQLAKHVGQFLCKDDDSIMPMNNLIRRYQVLMVKKAIEVSEIQFLNEDNEHRLASFRQEFFENDEDFVILFKKALQNEILKIRKLDENEIDLFTKKNLISRQFKVSAAFGNKDLTIKKSVTERRLDHLKLEISKLISKSNANKIVTLDESLDGGLLGLVGGIAGIVGNILVSEENTMLMKFTDNWESLGEISKMLFRKLQSRINNLHEYKFRVKVNKLPKLSFKRDEVDESLAKDFLKRLLFFTNQAEEKGVENLLKKEIKKHHCLKVDNVRVTADAIFLQYHDLIQRWWMQKEVSYLTKESTLFEDSSELIVGKSLNSIMANKFNELNLTYEYLSNKTFDEKPINWSEIMTQPPTAIFVTDGTLIEYTKVALSLETIEYSSFDLDYCFESSETDFEDIIIELRIANKNKLLIFFYKKENIIPNHIIRLEHIASVVRKKRIVFWVNKNLVSTIMEALYRK